ncbi:lipase family protein [Parabacteroides sp. OttesenSCG-928-G07]|nr:lipase family protein [Parabacteroides sp. OttesenSCG-928-G21]MDL2277637.1 lipase family protein [Parabacteroides sp. OttesenSCG-928-G07]
MVNQHHKFILFFLLLCGIFSCTTEDSPIFVPEKPTDYLVEIQQSITLDNKSLAERLGADAQNPLIALLPNNHIKIESILYKTKAPDGTPVQASGIIAYPESEVIRGVVVAEHFTITDNAEAPSSVLATFESALALYGYLVISPDYLGFGSTVHLPHPYIHAESSAQVSVDLIFATREYMEIKEIALDKKCYAVGYSQGGYAALAFAKMAEEKYPNDFTIQAIYAGGGPYEPQQMFDLLLEKDYTEYPASIPLTILGLDYADNLQLDLSGIFLEPLLSNYKTWYDKTKTVGQINRLLGSNTISNFLHPSVFSPEPSADVQKLYRSLEENRLTQWTPKAPITLIHGTEDAVVPFINAQMAYASFAARGCQVDSVFVKSGHQETAINFYMTLLNRLT